MLVEMLHEVIFVRNSRPWKVAKVQTTKVSSDRGAKPKELAPEIAAQAPLAAALEALGFLSSQPQLPPGARS